jgi:mRNA interferase MazF
MKTYSVKLTAEERETLLAIVREGEHQAAVIQRAHILLKSDEGRTDAAIAEVLYIGEGTAAQTRQRFCEAGLGAALIDTLPPEKEVKPDDGAKTSVKPLVINQGDVYWVKLDTPNGWEAGIPHPHVVIQDNLFNHSRITTVVTCALTSNIKRANIPGNVLLDIGEANLTRHSVVEVSKISTVDKTQLGEYIGSLSQQRIHQILTGMRFLQVSFFGR